VADFPTLDSWLSGAPDDHPLKSFVPIGVRLALDYILREIEEAKVLRWGDKRKRFRQLRKWTEFRELRAELILAALLVRNEIKVDFGDPYPDLVVENRLGIGVGCRTLDGPRDLADAVVDQIDPNERTVGLSFGGRPLRITQTQIDDVVAFAATAAPVGVPDLSAENTGYFAELDLTVAVMPPQEAWWGEDGGVEVQYGSRPGAALAPLVADLEQQMLNKMTEKAHQAGSMPTILFLDFSAVGLAWLRTTGLWTGSLEKLLKLDEGKPYAGLGLMVGSVNELSPRTMALAVQPSFEGDDLVGRIRSAFGATVVSDDEYPKIGTHLPPANA
jgi:hypothetical protein